MAFTSERIAKLPAPPRGRVYHYDDKVGGLCLCVTPTGAKTFYLYRKIDGRPERERLGRFPELTIDAARDAAREKIGAIAAGRNPAAERRRRRTTLTLDQAFEFYLERHARPIKRTWKEDERQYSRYLKSGWGNRRLNTIRKPDVAGLHAKMGKEHGIYAANRLRSMLGKLFAVVIDAELFPGPNPVLGVKKFREQSRDRFLDAAELKAFFAALNDEPRVVVRDYLKLSLLIGARRSNMLSMRWEDIDRDRGVWRIPQTKSGEPQVVPLSQAARDILEERWADRKGDCPWVFPSTSNHRSKTGHVQDVMPVWRAVIKRAGLENVRPHDLRRTLASWQAMLGTSELVIAKTLGHAPGSTATRVYARLQTDTVREAVENATQAMQKAAGLLESDTESGDDENEA